MMKIQVSFCHLSPRQFINHVAALSALPAVFHLVGNRLLSTPNRFLPLPAGLQQKLCPGFHAPPHPHPLHRKISKLNRSKLIASLIVADFTISVFGSSCNFLFFAHLFFFLFKCILKAGWDVKK